MCILIQPKKVAPKVEVDTEEEDLHDSDSDFSETPHQPVLNEAVSKSGRVRLKNNTTSIALLLLLLLLLLSDSSSVYFRLFYLTSVSVTCLRRKAK